MKNINMSYKKIKHQITYSIIILFFIIISNILPLHASENNYFPYELNLSSDALFLSTACIASGASIYLYTAKEKPTWWEVLRLKKNNINAFDRSAVSKSSKLAVKTSDVLSTAYALTPVFLSVPYIVRKEHQKIFTLFIMYSEVVIINQGLNNIAKGLINRERPYLYSSNLLKRRPMNKNSLMSFYSSHTSVAFSSLVFFAKVYSDIYKESKLKYLIWGICLSAASFTAYLRYAGGKHFPTDLITGAAIGSIIGYSIPFFHLKSDKSISWNPLIGNINGGVISFSY